MMPVEGPLRKRRSKQVTPAREQMQGVLVGELAGLTAEGHPLVAFVGTPDGRPVPARSVIAWSAADVGRELTLLFERGEPDKPIIMGFLQPPRPGPQPSQAILDGEQLVLTADREIVLRCGEASITLTRAGKVLIRGTYLLSRSSGANRIKGGSVQIN